MFFAEGGEKNFIKPDAELKYNSPEIYVFNQSGCCNYNNDNCGWSRESLYKIALSQLGKMPQIDDKLFWDLEAVANIMPGKHREAKEIFCRLLTCEHVGFTLATAILKFLNPNAFQVLNAYNSQIIMGDSLPPSKFDIESFDSYGEAASEYYFRYLDRLRELLCDGDEFRYADYVLGQVDKLMNC